MKINEDDRRTRVHDNGSLFLQMLFGPPGASGEGPWRCMPRPTEVDQDQMLLIAGTERRTEEMATSSASAASAREQTVAAAATKILGGLDAIRTSGSARSLDRFSRDNAKAASATTEQPSAPTGFNLGMTQHSSPDSLVCQIFGGHSGLSKDRL